ncbi:hypothetical protein [Marinimicrobium alkaliphilum]|uniref:hypothetical protein n=1 Tax=Marinimicrobium alkaliphilum TaxID=2202654 RepID=UPI0013001940|nr:hypothetical protein [Marinimicrobium alkaliphilum]
MRKIKAFLGFSAFGVPLMAAGLWAIHYQLVPLLKTLAVSPPVVVVHYLHTIAPGVFLTGLGLMVLTASIPFYSKERLSSSRPYKLSIYICYVALFVVLAGRPIGALYWSAHMSSKGYERCSSYQLLGRSQWHQSMWTQTREICEDPRVSELLRHYGLEGGMDAVRRHVERQH